MSKVKQHSAPAVDIPTRQMMHIGGSFAPPLTDALLGKYEMALNDAPRQIKDAMTKLHALTTKWWDLPDNDGTTKVEPHPSGRGTMVTLDEASLEALDELLPWPEELALYGRLFEEINPITDKDLRDAAHHLLWFANELSLNREPITTDKL